MVIDLLISFIDLILVFLRLRKINNLEQFFNIFEELLLKILHIILLLRLLLLFLIMLVLLLIFRRLLRLIFLLVFVVVFLEFRSEDTYDKLQEVVIVS